MYTRLAELYDVIYAKKDYANEARLLHSVINRCVRTPRAEKRTLLDVATCEASASYVARLGR